MPTTSALAFGGIPRLNATCPGGYEVHADDGGLARQATNCPGPIAPCSG